MSKNSRKTKEELNPLSQEINNFLIEIQGLHESFPLLMRALLITAQMKRKENKEFYKKYGKFDSKKKTYYVMQPYISRAKDFDRKVDIFHKAVLKTPESYFVTMVSLFDGYIGNLNKILLTLKPDCLNGSGKSISFEEAFKITSIENLKEYLLEKEVEGLLRSNHKEQFVWMENKYGIQLRTGLSSWANFVELTERRNLFVHTNGKVSTQYLKICEENGLDISKIKTGQDLDVSPEYFEQSYQILFELAVKLTHVLWRKLLPNEIEEADINLNEEICFLLLKDKEYSLAINLLEFASKELKKHSSDMQKRVYILNEAIAYKWNKENKKAQEIIESEDWSATNDQLQIAIAVLKDDFKLASEIMTRMGIKSMITKADYLEWPLYKEFRKSKIFLETYKKIYGEQFDREEEEAAKHKQDLTKKLN